MMKTTILLSTLLSSTVVVASSQNGIVQHLNQLQQQEQQQQHRRTQDVDPCKANNGDLQSVRSFYEDSLGECKCMFSNDLASLANFDQDALGDPETNTNFLTDVVDLINDILRSLSYEYSNSCVQSNCETCYGPVCGTITAAESIAVQGKSDTNLTLNDIFALPGLSEALDTNADPDNVANTATENVTALTNLFGPNLSTENSIKYCMAFTTEFTGESCLEISNLLDGEIVTEFSSEAQDCSLTYNGQSCGDCQFSVVEDGTNCVTADCTGIASIGTMIDTCAGTGMVGPMQFLDISATSESTCNEQTLIVTCEGTSCGDNVADASSGATVYSSALWTMGAAAVVALVL